ncbi:OPT oligopeptide transporter protein-domain-containing protein [Zopfochytrium polystomum]|nr:OPT oligopeptide transporter protein-domain-containing protein [Zopfochytrium polystomum]
MDIALMKEVISIEPFKGKDKLECASPSRSRSLVFVLSVISAPTGPLNRLRLYDMRSLSSHISPLEALDLSLLFPSLRWFSILLEDLYEKLHPVRIAPSFALEYLASFIVFGSSLVHVGLWYGEENWRRSRTAMRNLDTSNVHARMMDVHPDVPDLWYIILLAVHSFLYANRPSVVAISGQQIGLNVMSEFLTGSSSSAVAFKTLSYMSMSQGLLLVADLKLGHYLKMRPRTMFVVQLTSTLIANIYVVPGDPTSGKAWKLQVDQRDRWASNFNVFLNAGAIWGAIGLACFFDRGSPYVTTVWGFLVGVLAPIFPFVSTSAYMAFTVNGHYQIAFPYGKVQYADTDGCAPDYYQTCAGNANYGALFGKEYDITQDEYCSSINFGWEAASRF